MISNKITIKFLKIGIFALGFAGFYSISLVIIRTPYLANLISNPQIFKIALITHVNLSVLVWLMSITCAIWSLKVRCDSFIVISVFIGAILIAISPVIGGEPIMNNYVPILENIIFILGLSLFLIGIFLFSIQNLSLIIKLKEHEYISTAQEIYIDVCILTSSLIFIASSLCFIMSYISLVKIIQIIEIDIEYYYELLFWSFGHLIQFLYTQILMTIWVIILDVSIGNNQRCKSTYIYILIANLILSLIGILGHFYYDIISQEFKEFYTTHMKYVGGICPVICLGFIAKELVNNQRLNNFYIIIIASAILFLAGGAIGYKITEINVTVPAHYHGMIVGISVAFMGFAYLLITDMRTINSKIYELKATCYNLSKFQIMQIWIITLGQAIHITGLAIAGGYGALRKTTAMSLSINAKFGLGLMGIGGVAAIIGGFMFVCICVRHIYSSKSTDLNVPIMNESLT